MWERQSPEVFNPVLRKKFQKFHVYKKNISKSEQIGLLVVQDVYKSKEIQTCVLIIRYVYMGAVSKYESTSLFFDYKIPSHLKP